MCDYIIYSTGGNELCRFYLKDINYINFVDNIIKYTGNKEFKLMKYDSDDIIFSSELINRVNKFSWLFCYEKNE